jgi:hypothetical protein
VELLLPYFRIPCELVLISAEFLGIPKKRIFTEFRETPRYSNMELQISLLLLVAAAKLYQWLTTNYILSIWVTLLSFSTAGLRLVSNNKFHHPKTNSFYLALIIRSATFSSYSSHLGSRSILAYHEHRRWRGQQLTRGQREGGLPSTIKPNE